MAGFIGNLAYGLGRKLGPKFRKARWLYKTMSEGSKESIKAEYELGLDIYSEVAEKLTLNKNASFTRLLKGIGTKLGSKVSDKNWRFHFYLYSDPTPNAFAIPGGFVFVADSLIDLCGADKNELAFILSHEMGHVVKRHCFHRTINEYAVNTLKTVPAKGKFAPIIKNAGLDFFIKNYSRKQEMQADEFAVYLSYASGFNPAAGARMMKALGDKNPARDDYMKYFSTHPPHNERIVHILSICKRITKKSKAT
ncbi:M48 family metallopeptidase [Sedimentisphaera salicampi]|uniref:Metalloprotease LoiP n=1 Tax=Sedimentisphaera salicampi TaxID=1941349 RepID=A0A1W6LNG2_9BACT|nr:M48 family metallopeptidase [Sedimentisphaera salicampi]ARN57340.1 Metalloprotease LoiP precursor [Sedimentisphaera salicampi]OXU14653.1 Metalloprotease LoiP precursor [Sedimentisphaera salicampi]